MKNSIVLALMLGSSLSFAYTQSSTYRSMQDCRTEDRLMGRPIQIDYQVRRGEKCTDSTPVELSCSIVGDSIRQLNNGNCEYYKYEQVEVSVFTDNGRLVKTIPIVTKTTLFCPSAKMPPFKTPIFSCSKYIELAH